MRPFPAIVSQQKHLLEALSGKGGSPSQGGAPSAGPSPQGSRGGLQLGGSRLQWLVLAQVVLLVVAFLLGRASVQQAEASEAERAGSSVSTPTGVTAGVAPTGVAPTGAPQAQPAAAASGGALPVRAEPTPVSAAEQALRDPRNVYTLKVADYVYNDSSVRLAQDAARYLVESAGLPACLVQKGTRVYLLVGAAPRQVDLDDLGRTVRQLKGPPPISKPGEFHDAYVEKIDKVFQRK